MKSLFCWHKSQKWVSPSSKWPKVQGPLKLFVNLKELHRAPFTATTSKGLCSRKQFLLFQFNRYKKTTLHCQVAVRWYVVPKWWVNWPSVKSERTFLWFSHLRDLIEEAKEGKITHKERTRQNWIRSSMGYQVIKFGKYARLNGHGVLCSCGNVLFISPSSWLSKIFAAFTFTCFCLQQIGLLKREIFSLQPR